MGSGTLKGFSGPPFLGTVLPDQGPGVNAARGVSTQLEGQVEKEESVNFYYRGRDSTAAHKGPTSADSSSKPEVKDRGKVPESRPHTEGQMAGGVVLVAGKGRWDMKRRMG